MTNNKGFVYTLELQDACFYVGFSADPETRIASHFLGRGAQWTRLHPPISVLTVLPGDEVLENATTIAMMAKHGWRTVRGGRFLVTTMLSPPPPLLKAYSLKAPPALSEQTEIETILGHCLVVERIGDHGRWRARISGMKAATECPRRGFKTLYAESEEILRGMVAQWCEDGGADGNEEAAAASLPDWSRSRVAFACDADASNDKKSNDNCNDVAYDDARVSSPSRLAARSTHSCPDRSCPVDAL
jgi:predicted GIY-YIG superfamily endonuclease